MEALSGATKNEMTSDERAELERRVAERTAERATTCLAAAHAALQVDPEYLGLDLDEEGDAALLVDPFSRAGGWAAVPEAVGAPVQPAVL